MCVHSLYARTQKGHSDYKIDKRNHEILYFFVVTQLRTHARKLLHSSLVLFFEFLKFALRHTCLRGCVRMAVPCRNLQTKETQGT